MLFSKRFQIVLCSSINHQVIVRLPYLQVVVSLHLPHADDDNVFSQRSFQSPSQLAVQFSPIDVFQICERDCVLRIQESDEDAPALSPPTHSQRPTDEEYLEPAGQQRTAVRGPWLTW